MSTRSSSLARLWRGWLRVAKLVGDLNARVIFSVLYFVLGGPIALVVQRRSDPLLLHTRRASYWFPVEEDGTLEGARRQH